jgi:tetratricopeptide (TPR) repeat protein
MTEASAIGEQHEEAAPTLSTLGIRFSRIHELYEMMGGLESLLGKKTRDLKPLVQKLTRQSGLSLCSQLDACTTHCGLVANSNWFISHAWDYKFLDVMEAVKIFVDKEYDIHSTDEVVIWMDFFSVSQHVQGVLPFKWYSTIFMEAVTNIGNVLMVMEPWDDPLTLTRAWCVFEILASMSTNCRFEVSMSFSETERFSAVINEGGIAEQFHRMLGKVNTSRSTAFSDTDREQIHGAVLQILPGGFVELDSMVLRTLEAWMVSRLESALHADADVKTSVALRLQLSVLFRLLGRLDKALKYAVDCSELSRIAKCDEFVAIRSCYNLGNVYFAQGKYDAADSLYRSCISTHAMLFGTDDLNIQPMNLSLGNLYSAQKRYDEAVPLFQRCYDTLSRIRGSQHPATVSALHSLAIVYNSQGKFELAEQLFARCLEISSGTRGQEHPETLSIMGNLANAYLAHGRFELAEQLYTRCLDLRTRVQGPTHPETLTCIGNLGVLYIKQEKYEKAEPLYWRCHEIRSPQLGPQHPDTLSIMVTLAQLYATLSQYDKALAIRQECIANHEKYYGEDDPKTVQVKKIFEM